MMLFLLMALMSALVLALLLPPLLRCPAEGQPRAAYDLDVYKDQLAELARDSEAGLLAPDQVAAARLEIERRMLAADSAGKAPNKTARSRFAALAVALLVPGLAAGLYLMLGEPGVPDQPAASRAQGDAEEQARMAKMVVQLAERMRQRPDDLEGWLMLARSYRALGQTNDSVAAWRKALALSGNKPDIAADLGETLVMAANGQVTPEAQQAFSLALKDGAKQPKARFYSGLGIYQAGDGQGALQIWVDLEADSTSDAPWLPGLRQRIEEVAGALAIDPATLKTSTGTTRAPQPSPEDEQAAMVRSMVEKLAARLKDQPDDAEGWMRLGQSYLVLDQADKARDAYAKAAALRPGDVQAKLAYAQALLAADSDGRTPIPPFVQVMRDVLALDPANPDALWYVGAAEAESGHSQAALDLFGKLLAQLPQGTPGRGEVEDQIKALRGSR